MFRLAERYLSEWIGNKRRKPLIIRGARQVGKSTLVRNFARKQGLTLIEINLEKHIYLDEIFKTFDIDMILRELDSISAEDLDNKSLIFLDEIQACPYALPCLRYFYEERKDIPVISAGSLLEFVLREHKFSMPVGRVEYFHLAPMTFVEFLLSLNEKKLIKYMTNFSLENPIPISSHKKLLDYQRLFLYIGGMPESVMVYRETKSVKKVKQTHRSIIQTYKDDFVKYTKKSDLIRLDKIFQKIPQIVGKKVKYSNISREDRSKKIKEAIDILIKAKILLPVFHSNCTGLPLRADENDHVYKLYFLDIGLFNYICGLDWTAISKLDNHDLVNEGVLAEQFIAQHLYYRNGGIEEPNLNYWVRETRSSNAEVDFVITLRNKILPIEVKSGKSGTLKSILFFCHMRNINHALQFDLNIPSIQKINHLLKLKDHTTSTDFELISLPLYLVENPETNLPLNDT